MAVLPENSIDLSGGVEFVAQPSLTWKIDRAAGRIAGTCDGYDAVKQAVEIILNVERYRWQIYQPASGMQWDGLVGQDARLCCRRTAAPSAGCSADRRPHHGVKNLRIQHRRAEFDGEFYRRNSLRRC